MNNSSLNINDYIMLDSLYVNFTDDIDKIPFILSSEDIDVIEINDEEYISKNDYKTIKNSIYLKRNSKEITIDSSKDDNLITFEPCSDDTSYFLNLIYELNNAQEALIIENNQLKETIKNLTNELSLLKNKKPI